MMFTFTRKRLSYITLHDFALPDECQTDELLTQRHMHGRNCGIALLSALTSQQHEGNASDNQQRKDDIALH